MELAAKIGTMAERADDKWDFGFYLVGGNWGGYVTTFRELIPFTEGHTLRIGGTLNTSPRPTSLHWLDAGGNYISYLGVSDRTYIAPAGTAFIRLCVQVGDMEGIVLKDDTTGTVLFEHGDIVRGLST